MSNFSDDDNPSDDEKWRQNEHIFAINSKINRKNNEDNRFDGDEYFNADEQRNTDKNNDSNDGMANFSGFDFGNHSEHHSDQRNEEQQKQQKNKGNNSKENSSIMNKNNHSNNIPNDQSAEDEFDLFGAFNQKYNFEENLRNNKDQKQIDKQNGFDFFAIDNNNNNINANANTNTDHFMGNYDENPNSNTDKIGFWVRHKINEQLKGDFNTEEKKSNVTHTLSNCSSSSSRRNNEIMKKEDTSNHIFNGLDLADFGEESEATGGEDSRLEAKRLGFDGGSPSNSSSSESPKRVNPQKEQSSRYNESSSRHSDDFDDLLPSSEDLVKISQKKQREEEIKKLTGMLNQQQEQKEEQENNPMKEITVKETVLSSMSLLSSSSKSTSKKQQQQPSVLKPNDGITTGIKENKSINNNIQSTLATTPAAISNSTVGKVDTRPSAGVEPQISLNSPESLTLRQPSTPGTNVISPSPVYSEDKMPFFSSASLMTKSSSNQQSNNNNQHSPEAQAEELEGGESQEEDNEGKLNLDDFPLVDDSIDKPTTNIPAKPLSVVDEDSQDEQQSVVLSHGRDIRKRKETDKEKGNDNVAGLDNKELISQQEKQEQQQVLKAKKSNYYQQNESQYSLLSMIIVDLKKEQKALGQQMHEIRDEVVKQAELFSQNNVNIDGSQNSRNVYQEQLIFLSQKQTEIAQLKKKYIDNAGKIEEYRKQRNQLKIRELEIKQKRISEKKVQQLTQQQKQQIVEKQQQQEQMIRQQQQAQQKQLQRNNEKNNEDHDSKRSIDDNDVEVNNKQIQRSQIQNKTTNNNITPISVVKVNNIKELSKLKEMAVEMEQLAKQASQIKQLNSSTNQPYQQKDQVTIAAPVIDENVIAKVEESLQAQSQQIQLLYEAKDHIQQQLQAYTEAVISPRNVQSPRKVDLSPPSSNQVIGAPYQQTEERNEKAITEIDPHLNTKDQNIKKIKWWSSDALTASSTINPNEKIINDNNQQSQNTSPRSNLPSPRTNQQIQSLLQYKYQSGLLIQSQQSISPRIPIDQVECGNIPRYLGKEVYCQSDWIDNQTIDSSNNFQFLSEQLAQTNLPVICISHPHVTVTSQYQRGNSSQYAVKIILTIKIKSNNPLSSFAAVPYSKHPSNQLRIEPQVHRLPMVSQNNEFHFLIYLREWNPNAQLIFLRISYVTAWQERMNLSGVIAATVDKFAKISPIIDDQIFNNLWNRSRLIIRTQPILLVGPITSPQSQLIQRNSYQPRCFSWEQCLKGLLNVFPTAFLTAQKDIVAGCFIIAKETCQDSLFLFRMVIIHQDYFIVQVACHELSNNKDADANPVAKKILPQLLEFFYFIVTNNINCIY